MERRKDRGALRAANLQTKLNFLFEIFGRFPLRKTLEICFDPNFSPSARIGPKIWGLQYLDELYMLVFLKVGGPLLVDAESEKQVFPLPLPYYKLWF